MKQLTVTEIRAKIRGLWPKEWLGGTVYGVPRGGWGIAALLDAMGLAGQVSTPEEAAFIVDDIIDSGDTRDKWMKLYPNKPFWSPYDKTKEPFPWLVFPWEGSKEQDAEDTVRRILQHIGENPNREGLLDTPKRVVKSWKELFAGYFQKPEEILSRVFSSDSDEMVICRDIEFYSMCEHHMIPFFGTASIGYLPGKRKIVGLSKLARLVDCFARRLQVQEQLTREVAIAIQTHIPGALGVGVIIRAKHLCMCGRGVGKQGSSMVTSAMLGKFREDPAVRSEFLELVKGG